MQADYRKRSIARSHMKTLGVHFTAKYENMKIYLEKATGSLKVQ